jgi:hypothetical protein
MGLFLDRAPVKVQALIEDWKYAETKPAIRGLNRPVRWKTIDKFITAPQYRRIDARK